MRVPWEGGGKAVLPREKSFAWGNAFSIPDGSRRRKNGGPLHMFFFHFTWPALNLGELSCILYMDSPAARGQPPGQQT